MTRLDAAAMLTARDGVDAPSRVRPFACYDNGGLPPKDRPAPWTAAPNRASRRAAGQHVAGRVVAHASRVRRTHRVALRITAALKAVQAAGNRGADAAAVLRTAAEGITA